MKQQGGKKMDNLILAAMLVMIIGYMMWRNQQPEPAREMDATVSKRLQDLSFRLDNLDSNSIKSVDLDQKIDKLNLRVENDRVNNDSRHMEMTNEVSRIHKLALSPKHTELTQTKPILVDIVRHEKVAPAPELKPVEKIKPKKVSSR